MISLADPRFEEAERMAVDRVLADGMVADGPEVRKFEEEFANFCDAEHAVAAANGTAALHAALEALEIGQGDTVVTTPFSFVASSNAIRLAGATPVFADIDPATFNLDPEAADQAVARSDADAVLVVHLYGLPANMAAFQDLAEDRDVKLIEDAAQAHGGTYWESSVGSFGDAAAFSFYPTKNMTTGEGGIVLAKSEAVADRAASYVNHGRTGDGTYAHQRVGHNYRMTSLAAAIGRVQLEKLPAWIDRRRSNAATLSSALEGLPDLKTPTEPVGRKHAYHQYTLRTSRRESLRDSLEAADVASGTYYPTPIHKLEAYEGFDPSVPNAEQAAEEVLSLPVHPHLSASDLDRIVEATRSAVRQPSA